MSTDHVHLVVTKPDGTVLDIKNDASGKLNVTRSKTKANDYLHVTATDATGATVDVSGFPNYKITDTLQSAGAPGVPPPNPPPPVVPPVTPPVVPPVTPPPTGAPTIPANAKVVDMLNPSRPWQMNHDPGTPGTASGTTSYPVTAPDGTANCRLFQFSGTGHGGEIYHTHGLDNSGTFNTVCYETLEYMDAASIANVAQYERDSEHVDPNGTVHDLAMQVSNGVIEITGNRHWQSTGIHVPDRKADTWVLSKRYERDNGDGTCTYIGYEQDGVFYPIGKTLPQVGGSKWASGIWNVQYQANVKQDNVPVKVWAERINLSFWQS